VNMIVTGGSGRFEDVSSEGAGNLEVSAVNEPFTFEDPTLVYSWTIKGKINLGKK